MSKPFITRFEDAEIEKWANVYCVNRAAFRASGYTFIQFIQDPARATRAVLFPEFADQEEAFLALLPEQIAIAQRLDGRMQRRAA